MNFFNTNKEDENRKRLQNLVNQTKLVDEPDCWRKSTFAIGGLTEIGFSKHNPNLLLVISSQGRGLIDCQNSELIERDNDTNWDWINSYELTSHGIGVLSNEIIFVSGLHGGGLPLMNKNGDGLLYMATEWPIIDIIFEPNFKSIYKQNEAKECFRIFHDYELITYGFSYDGETFIIATSSEINIYRNKKNGS
ncbi:hypothetical protein HX039_18170 [Myroides marinus]|uniref:hypothetical protein n=1 Tax=Myroides marinus TaxID=703342 RepID=UPI0025766F8D|nr:hypothetical protein [Myroides marinus]MDM1406003.1 hypothetical protein [Myroides marinus]